MVGTQERKKVSTNECPASFVLMSTWSSIVFTQPFPIKVTRMVTLFKEMVPSHFFLPFTNNTTYK